MSKFTEYIGSQFGNPRGIIGKICCVLMNVINRAMYRKTVTAMDICPGDKVLDIGYGNGYLLQQIDKKCEAELYGIDISDDMRLQATKRNKRAEQAGRLSLRVGDCCDLPYEDNMFDGVTSINTIYFWADTVRGLSEIYRVLKPGKSFYNVVYTKEWLDKLSYTKKGFKKYDPAQLMELGRAAGFEQMKIEDIVKGKSFVVIYTKNGR